MTRTSGENGGETGTVELVAASPAQMQLWHQGKLLQKPGKTFPSAHLTLLTKILSEVTTKEGITFSPLVKQRCPCYWTVLGC